MKVIFFLIIFALTQKISAASFSSVSISSASNSFFTKIFLHSKSKIVILDFWADWCMPCIKMVRILNSISSKHKDKILLIKVNVDEFKEFSRHVGIKSIPCVWMFSGDKVKKISGIKSELELNKEVEHLYSQLYKKT